MPEWQDQEGTQPAGSMLRDKIRKLLDEADHVRDSDPESAVGLIREAMTKSEELGDSALLRKSELELVKFYRQSGQDVTAREILDRIGSSLTAGDPPELICEFKIQNGIYHDVHGYPIKALESYREALALAREHGETLFEYQTIHNMGIVWAKLGEFEKSLDCYLKSLAWDEKNDQSLSVATTCMNIGVLYFEMGQPEQAVEYSKRAFSLYESLGNRGGMARVYNSLGVFHKAAGRFKDAFDCLLKSLELKMELDDRIGVATTKQNIGHLMQDQGDYQKALEYFHDALSLKRSLGLKGKQGSTLGSLAFVYRKLGQFEAARLHYDEAVQLYREQNLKEGLHIVLRDYSEMLYELGEYKTACEYSMEYAKLYSLLYSERMQRTTAEMNARYTAEKQEREALIHRLKNIELQRANREITRQKQALESAQKDLERMARTDTLTGLSNRRGFLEAVSKVIQIHDRTKRFSVVGIADIDHFKKINDTWGHDAGDWVLRKVSVCLEKSIRQQDALGRWGGEEFILFLPETELAGAVTLSEKIRLSVQDFDFEYKGSQIPVTITLGLSVRQPDEGLERALKRADKALYRGKKDGRNRVVSEG